MKVKTAELIGHALDWAVAKCEGKPLIYKGRMWPTQGEDTVEYAPWAVHKVKDACGPYAAPLCRSAFTPSTDWAQGGPIIEREGIEVVRGNDLIFPKGNEKGEYTEPLWLAACGVGRKFHGPTPLISAMRCFVASKLGDEVEIPEELL